MRWVLPLCLLMGCVRTPPSPRFSTPPGTPLEACESIRYFFENAKARPAVSVDAASVCHVRVTAGDFRGGQLRTYLEKTGWKRDPRYGKGGIPGAYAYQTPESRCTVDEARAATTDKNVHTGVGVTGGTGVAPTYGVGIGIGPVVDAKLDYKIECRAK